MLKKSITETIESTVDVYACDVCGLEIYKERDGEFVFDDKERNRITVQISTYGKPSCIHAVIMDICNNCNDKVVGELKETIIKLGFKTE